MQGLIRELFCGNDKRADDAARIIINEGASSLPYLLPYVHNEDADKRWWAVRTIAEIHHESVPSILIPLLMDPDESIQQCAALGLRLQPHPDAGANLLSLVESSNQLSARLSADALIAIGAPVVLDLITMLQNGPPRARLEAVRALALIKDPRAIPALFAVLSEESITMDYWGNEGLDKMGVGTVYIQP